MGGRISWIMVAVALVAAGRAVGEEPEILPVWSEDELSTIAPGNEQRPLFQGPKEQLELPSRVADQALTETDAPAPVKLWENGYQGWRYRPAPLALSRDYQKYYPNLVPAAVTQALDAGKSTTVNPAPAGLNFAADVQYFPAAPESKVVLVAQNTPSKLSKKSAFVAPPVAPLVLPAVAAPAAAAPAAVCTPPAVAVSSPLSKKRRQRRAEWSEALQSPAEIAPGDNAETITLGQLLERIHAQHGLPVRIDLAHVLPMTSMAEMTTARLTPKRSGNQTARIPSPLGLMPYGVTNAYSAEPAPPVYSNPGPLSPSNGGPYYAPEPLPAPATYAPGAIAPPVSPAAPAALKAYKPVAESDYAYEDEPTPPVSAVKAQVVGESVDDKPAPKAAPATDEKENANDEEKSQPHEAAQAIQQMLAEMLSTPVDANVIHQPGATVEDVLRQAFDRSFPLQALINASLSEEIPVLALTSLSKATEWDLLVLDDGVLLTTKLNANLHKETRVYSTRELEKTAGLKAEDVARVLTRTVRPWSWKKNFPEAATAAVAKPATEAKRSAKTGKALSIPKIDLSLLSLLFSSRSPLPKHIRLASDDDSSSPITINGTDSENVELTEEQLELLGRAWDGLFQVAVSSIQVIYHADPPTGVIEVLPGMLVISQSQGAHREIADLLEQLSQPEN